MRIEDSNGNMNTRTARLLLCAAAANAAAPSGRALLWPLPRSMGPAGSTYSATLESSFTRLVLFALGAVLLFWLLLIKSLIRRRYGNTGRSHLPVQINRQELEHTYQCIQALRQIARWRPFVECRCWSTRRTRPARRAQCARRVRQPVPGD